MENKESLENIIDSSNLILNIDSLRILDAVKKHILLIAKNCYKQKGLYTVLVTLLYYKYLHPKQDIRKHQKQINGGFSGRSFDTRNVTPILKKKNLPAMNESGWLTRSLEQPEPYDFNYPGKIPAKLKQPFLEVLDYIENGGGNPYACLQYLLYFVHREAVNNVVTITPLSNPEKLTIKVIINSLKEHFLSKYGTHNGAKLPVLAFHAIYQCLIKEVKRYEGCSLADLASLTACDATSKASGDIEIFRDGKLFEAIEIKLDKLIDEQILNVAKEKIYKWNPKRYYILSVLGIKDGEEGNVNKVVKEVAQKHGCQIIINGLLPTIKYYLRLISNLSDFMEFYSHAVEVDTELQKIHKDKWNEIISKLKL